MEGGRDRFSRPAPQNRAGRAELAHSRVRRKGDNIFLRKHIHKFFMSADDLRKERGGLLPLALFGDVAVIASAKRKDREKVRLVLEIITQPAPRGVVCRSNLREGRRAEPWIFADERGYLHRIHIADRPEAASPGVTITIRSQKVPPKPHLFSERGLDGLHNVEATRCLGGFIDSSRVLV